MLLAADFRRSGDDQPVASGLDDVGRLASVERRFDLSLSNLRLTIILTDEQAKLNVNRLIDWTNRTQAQRVVRQVIASVGRPASQGSSVSLRPLPRRSGADRGDAGLSPIGSYSQVFNTDDPQALAGRSAGTGLTSRLTCWGDGQLNVRKAPDELVRLACDPLLRPSEIQALLDARQRLGEQTLNQWLDQVDTIDDDQQKAVVGRLTDESRCFGVWVIGQDDQRTWYSFAVATTGTSASGSAGGLKITRWTRLVW